MSRTVNSTAHALIYAYSETKRMSPRTFFGERIGQWSERKQGCLGERGINAHAARLPRGSERAFAPYTKFLQPLRELSIAYVDEDLITAPCGSANEDGGSDFRACLKRRHLSQRVHVITITLAPRRNEKRTDRKCRHLEFAADQANAEERDCCTPRRTNSNRSRSLWIYATPTMILSPVPRWRIKRGFWSFAAGSCVRYPLARSSFKRSLIRKARLLLEERWRDKSRQNIPGNIFYFIWTSTLTATSCCNGKCDIWLGRHTRKKCFSRSEEWSLLYK